MERKSEEQRRAIENIKKLYKGWEKVIKLSDDYPKIVPEGK